MWIFISILSYYSWIRSLEHFLWGNSTGDKYHNSSILRSSQFLYFHIFRKFFLWWKNSFFLWFNPSPILEVRPLKKQCVIFKVCKTYFAALVSLWSGKPISLSWLQRSLQGSSNPSRGSAGPRHIFINLYF